MSYKDDQKLIRQKVYKVTPLEMHSGEIIPDEKSEKNASNAKNVVVSMLQALQHPMWHYTVDLKISEFKRGLKEAGIPKSTRNKLVRDYKNKAWGEYGQIIGFKGSFPTVGV